MQYGIQRRSIYLVPPTETDRAWIFDRFEEEEIWSMFGFEGPSKQMMTERHATGALVFGVVRRVEDRRRIGFIVCFPPTPPANAWEFGIAIPDPRERDAYAAINASDAVAHYTFDHLQIERATWRIRDDNRPSRAIALRMGYRPYGAWDLAGHRYHFFRLSRERWAERYGELDRGEERHASGLPDTFVTLEGPPYEPIAISPSSSGSGEDSPPA